MDKTRLNYTQEQTEYIVSQYTQNPERYTVELLAQEMGRSIKSIIGKLSREGVYRREAYKTKGGEEPVTKTELVVQIAEKLGLDSKILEGLEKAPKAALKALEEAI